MHHRRFSRPAKVAGWLVIGVVLVLLAVVYAYAGRITDRPGERLVSLLLAERFTPGRLAGQTAWQACVPVDTAALVPRVRCGAPLPPRSRRFQRIADAQRDARAAPATGSPAVLRGGALLDLRLADTSVAVLNRVANALEEAHRRAPGDAGVLNDLAVAYLAVGERTQQLTPMLRALDTVERAMAADSMDPSILFNRALILQRLYLIRSAERAWRRYLAVERNPQWRGEAQAHARWVAAVPDTVSWDSLLHAPPGHVDARTRSGILRRVAQAPQAAREFGFTLFRDWAVHLRDGDTTRAGRLLLLADEIGRAEEQLGVDRSVLTAARAIRTAANSGVTETIARGHIHLEAGLQRFAAGANMAAVRELEKAEQALRAAGSPMARWAKFYRAAAAVNDVDYEAGDRLLGEVLEEAEPQEPALIGKTIWAQGLSQLRRGYYDAASRLYRRAEPHIARAREAENEGALAVLLAESLTLSGQTPAGRTWAYHALRRLAPFRRSNFLNNHLAIVASYARTEAFSHAALAITGEVVHVAREVGKPTVLAQAFAVRVRDLAGVRQWASAHENAERALAWADSIPDGRGGDRVRAHVHLALGQFTRSRDPQAALPLLRSAVESYSRFGSDFYLPTALYEAALAARTTGDTASAREWLLQAVQHVERQQASFTSTETRTTFYETAENLFDEVIGLELAARRPDAAFAMMERGRIHPWSVRTGVEPSAAPSLRPVELARLAASLPGDMLLVEYALLHDRLVVWAVSRAGSRQYTVAVSRDSVAALVNGLARRSGSDPDPYSTLYEILLRPLDGELRRARQLTVVPDRELYLVPFAALRDRAGGGYMMERFQIRTVPSATFFVAALSAPRSARNPPDALVVGDPALDFELGRGLGPLPGAAREARSVAAIYRDPVLLQGADARRDRVLLQLPLHSMFHFAGHAVFNPEQPELSYLALASTAPGNDGILRAREISGLRLSNVDVVVLSACSSLSPRASRTGAVTGLAYSFLRAGAPVTISTLWDVDDTMTREILVDFHRRLSSGSPAPEALRLAQVAAVRSVRPELQNPRTWAAFIYTGP